MIYYAIPLKANLDSEKWAITCKKLEVTILSIIRYQTCFKIVIVGHDKPNFLQADEFCKNSNIVFLHANCLVPKDSSEFMKDKDHKKNIAREFILSKANKNDYFMNLDADDVLSHDFYNVIDAAFNRNPDIDDIALYTGFVFDEKRKKIAYLDGTNKIFYRNCGSCFVSKLSEEDLKNSNNFLENLKNHTLFPEISLKFSRSVLACKIPIACYIVNHGSNDASLRVGDHAIESFVNQFECSDADLLREFKNKFLVDL